MAHLKGDRDGSHEMSNATQSLPDDPAFLKAVIAAFQAENVKMSATLQAMTN